MMTRTEARFSQESQLQPVKTHKCSKALQRTLQLRTFKAVNVSVHMSSQPSQLLCVAPRSHARSPVSGVRCQTLASSTRGWAFLDFTAQRCVVGSRTVSFFQAQEAQKQQ